MTAADVRIETLPGVIPRGGSLTRLLASALLHVLDRDEALPARWQSEPFVLGVASHRLALASLWSADELDRACAPGIENTFRGAVAALASDPAAAAMAVRRLELTRGTCLPAWPVIVRRGVGPRVSHADASRWFG